MPSFRAYAALARPAQWVKNGFVLVGLLFGHGWKNPQLLADGIACFFAFCLVSSAVYAVNDVLDRHADRAHASKRGRPVASGAIGVTGALLFAAFAGLAGLALAAKVSLAALALLLAYVVMNLGYSLGLKHVVVLDVIIIAAGFMLRILAGTLGIGIEPSRWLIFCGFMLTLFLGFAKRRAELAALMDEAAAVEVEGNDSGAGKGKEISMPSDRTARRVLAAYRLYWLDRIIAVCAAAAVIAYAFYTLDARTVTLHGTSALVFTVPVACYGMGRYLWTLYRRGGGADPAAQLWRDPHLLGAVLFWLLLAAWLIA